MRDISWLTPGLRVWVDGETGTLHRKSWRPYTWDVHFDDGETRIVNAARVALLHPEHDPRNSTDEACTFFRGLR